MAKQGLISNSKISESRLQDVRRKRSRREFSLSTAANPPDAIPRVEYAIHKGIDMKRILASRKEAEVEVRVPPKYLSTSNIAVQKRQLWGYEVYTDDSDIPCILQHTGNIALIAQPVDTNRYDFLAVRLHVQKHERGMPPFESRESNGLRSRAWGAAYDGARISIVSVARVIGDKYTVQEKPILASLQPYAPHLVRWGAWNSSISSEISLCFDLLNEPCLCFTITAVTDEGSGSSRRLQNEVIYLENNTCRYELSAVPSNGTTDESMSLKEEMPLLRFGRLKPETITRLRIEKSIAAPLRSKRRRSSVAEDVSKSDASADDGGTLDGKPDCLPVPLPNDAIDVTTIIRWTDLQWTPDGATVDGKHYSFSKLVFARTTS